MSIKERLKAHERKMAAMLEAGATDDELIAEADKDVDKLDRRFNSRETRIAKIYEEWNEDYSPATGMTAVCPICNEYGEVYVDTQPKRYLEGKPASRWRCDDCGHTSEWW